MIMNYDVKIFGSGHKLAVNDIGRACLDVYGVFGRLFDILNEQFMTRNLETYTRVIKGSIQALEGVLAPANQSQRINVTCIIVTLMLICLIVNGIAMW